MKQRITVLAMLLAIASALLIAPFSAAAAPSAAPTTGVTVPIAGSATNALGQLVNFAGNLNVTRFAVQNGQLVAAGTLTGTLTNTVTGVVQNVTRNITLPVAQATGTCQILHLVLGPLDLNLLGLRIQLNQVVLDITAQQGGGLLGDLLCAVANLLNNNGPLQGIARLLNQILGQL